MRDSLLQLIQAAVELADAAREDDLSEDTIKALEAFDEKCSDLEDILDGLNGVQ